MHTSTLLPALGLLATLTSARPGPPPPQPPVNTPAACYPPNSASRGFQLFVNVTDRTKDLSPPVHGSYFNLAHIGAGQSRGIAMAPATDVQPPIFYQNGTYTGFLSLTTSLV